MDVRICMHNGYFIFDTQCYFEFKIPDMGANHDRTSPR